MLNLRRLNNDPAYSRLRGLPPQDAQFVAYLAEIYRRFHDAHQGWAQVAKLCVDTVEGRQWNQAVRAGLHAQKRPAITLNMTASLVRLVMGYFQNNQTQIKYSPGNDEAASDSTAEVLSFVSKNLDQLNNMPHVQSQTFMMGIMTGRGFIDTKLDFSANDFGEITDTYQSPFDILLDPDCQDYDINRESAGTIRQRWMSRHMIHQQFGKAVHDALLPYFTGTIPIQGMITSQTFPGYDVMRGFGMDNPESPAWWQNTLQNLGPLIDPHRRAIKVLEFQMREMAWRLQFVDLETGDRELVPETFTDDQIQKVMYFAEQQSRPMALKELPYNQVRWTTIVGDKIVHDGRSPYESLTLSGFFPYFRDGITRGMVEDLLEPQAEKNKRRSIIMEYMSRTAAGGWAYADDTFTPTEEANLKRYGSTPGVNIKFRAATKHVPQQIEPATYPQGQERLEQNADQDFEAISGLNKSALGEIDRVQSGRAIEARQRQAVIGIQPYVTNWNLTMALFAKKRLEMIQNFYTEQRIIRVLGPSGATVQKLVNETILDPTSNALVRLNDITVGKYVVVPNDAPLTANIANMQFDQIIEMMEKVTPVLGPQAGGMLALTLVEPLLQNSSISDKASLIARVQQVLAMAGVPPAGQPMPMPGPLGAAPGMMGHNGGPPMEGEGQPPGGASPPGAVLPPGQGPAGPGPTQTPSLVTAGSNVIPLPGMAAAQAFKTQGVL